MRPFVTRSSMVIDAPCQRNLELVRNIYDGSTNGTLLSVLDHTVTSMAGRKLREWLLNPLLDPQEINKRLDAVAEIKDRHQVRSGVRTALGRVYDLERLISRVSLGVANARDLTALKLSFKRFLISGTFCPERLRPDQGPPGQLGRPRLPVLAHRSGHQ